MNKRHYQLLKNLCDESNDSVIPESDPRIEYLMSIGYVRLDPPFYRVTESGKSALEEYRSSRFLPWLSFWLSVIALAVSITVAILK